MAIEIIGGSKDVVFRLNGARTILGNVRGENDGRGGSWASVGVETFEIITPEEKEEIRKWALEEYRGFTGTVGFTKR